MAKNKTKKVKLGHQNFESNKKRREVRQEYVLRTAQILKSQRLSMLEKIHAKFPGKSSSWLRKQFGTLNIHRMESILNDAWENSSWFLNREAIKAARRAAATIIHQRSNDARPHKKKHKFQKNFKKKNLKEKQAPGISGGRNQGTE